MSLYGDFRRVWMERFPESDLPAAWEEDVRSNLMKHRQVYRLCLFTMNPGGCGFPQIL